MWRGFTAPAAALLSVAVDCDQHLTATRHRLGVSSDGSRTDYQYNGGIMIPRRCIGGSGSMERNCPARCQIFQGWFSSKRPHGFSLLRVLFLNHSSKNSLTLMMSVVKPALLYSYDIAVVSFPGFIIIPKTKLFIQRSVLICCSATLYPKKGNTMITPTLTPSKRKRYGIGLQVGQ